ncbi:MAG: hypothetical protein ACYDGN_09200 [Acidimicrobiales bacterium]
MTYNKWLQPARVGDWTLDFDDRHNPTSYVVCRRDVEVLRLPSAPLDDAVVEALVARTAMPAGTAAQLDTQLALKMASPKREWVA